MGQRRGEKRRDAEEQRAARRRRAARAAGGGHPGGIDARRGPAAFRSAAARHSAILFLASGASFVANGAAWCPRPATTRRPTSRSSAPSSSSLPSSASASWAPKYATTGGARATRPTSLPTTTRGPSGAEPEVPTRTGRCRACEFGTAALVTSRERTAGRMRIGRSGSSCGVKANTWYRRPALAVQYIDALRLLSGRKLLRDDSSATPDKFHAPHSSLLAGRSPLSLLALADRSSPMLSLLALAPAFSAVTTICAAGCLPRRETRRAGRPRCRNPGACLYPTAQFGGAPPHRLGGLRPAAPEVRRVPLGSPRPNELTAPGRAPRPRRRRGVARARRRRRRRDAAVGRSARLHAGRAARAAAHELHRDRGGRLGRRLVRAGAYTLPAPIAAAVEAIFGLHGLPLPPTDKYVRSSAGRRLQPGPPPSPVPRWCRSRCRRPVPDGSGEGVRQRRCRQAVAEFSGRR